MISTRWTGMYRITNPEELIKRVQKASLKKWMPVYKFLKELWISKSTPYLWGKKTSQLSGKTYNSLIEAGIDLDWIVELG